MMLINMITVHCGNTSPHLWLEIHTLLKMRIYYFGCVSLLQVRLSNNDFLGVRFRVIGSQGYTKGDVRVLWQE